MPTIYEIAQHKHEWRLCCHESVPALTEEGEARTGDRMLSMMVHEAIDYQRSVAHSLKPEREYSEYELLESYININHAWVARDKGDHARRDSC